MELPDGVVVRGLEVSELAALVSPGTSKPGHAGRAGRTDVVPRGAVHAVDLVSTDLTL